MEETRSVTKADVEARFRPFVRMSPEWTIYERVRTGLMTVFVLPVRMMVFFVALGILWVLARIVLVGSSEEAMNEDQDWARWRRAVASLVRPIARVVLLISFGVFWIEKRKVGESVETKKVAPIIVSNHLGYLDIVVLLVKYGGAFVAKKDISETRFVGSIARSLQCLFVTEGGGVTKILSDRSEKTFQCQGTEEHRNVPFCHCPRPMIVFPEGTTTNGTALITFRRGAFHAGLPVLPVAVRFPHRRFNLSWETIRFKEHLWRSMTQIYNRVQIIEMPVYYPSEEERMDPSLFTRNVQKIFEETLELETYPLNRKQKFAYHSYVLGKISGEELFQKADELAAQDPLLVSDNP